MIILYIKAINKIILNKIKENKHEVNYKEKKVILINYCHFIHICHHNLSI